MKLVGLELDPKMQIGSCSVAQKQLIELAKVISDNVKVLIMDEPTSALNDVETEHLFQFIHSFSLQEAIIPRLRRKRSVRSAQPNVPEAAQSCAGAVDKFIFSKYNHQCTLYDAYYLICFVIKRAHSGKPVCIVWIVFRIAQPAGKIKFFGGAAAMQMRKISLIAAGIALLLTIAAAIGFLAYISPPRDEVESFYYPPEFFCASAENRIDYQTNGKCAAYAAAYLLRHFGEDADGEALFPELKRPLGFVSANSIMDVFERHGYHSKAYHGSVDTLKQRLAAGNPVIVFIRIPGDTHYAVVVGYDEQYIYLADSLAENANASDAQYNRVLTTEEFEAVWKTGTLLPDNIYITRFKKAGRYAQQSFFIFSGN